MYLDYKATIWFRIPIESKQALETIVKRLSNGELPSDLYNYENSDEDLEQCEPLYDTEKFISPNENDGQSTIEVYDFKKINNCTQPIIIWDNSYKSEIKRLNETKM